MKKTVLGILVMAAVITVGTIGNYASARSHGRMYSNVSNNAVCHNYCISGNCLRSSGLNEYNYCGNCGVWGNCSGFADENGDGICDNYSNYVHSRNGMGRHMCH